MRRYAFYGHLIDSVEGFDRLGGWAIPFRNAAGREAGVCPGPVVVSRLRRKRPLCAEEFTYLRARTDRVAKTTLISAQQAAAYYDSDKSRNAYPRIENYLADLVDILRDEVRELIRLGCTYIQIDSPQYTALLDPQLREGYRRRGNDPDRLLDLSIEMDNAVIGEHPGILFGLHLCRGNNQSKFYAEGDYGPIARIFRNTRFQRFLLEYDDARSGGFEPLREVPEDRTVVLGLISSKTPALEDKDELKQRISSAAKFVPLERLALSPQCGFASTMEGNLLSPRRPGGQTATGGRDGKRSLGITRIERSGGDGTRRSVSPFEAAHYNVRSLWLTTSLPTATFISNRWICSSPRLSS